MFSTIRALRLLTNCLMVAAFIIAVPHASCAPVEFDTEELYRIRIENISGGLVGVSVDGGKNYSTVGRVEAPAVSRTMGFGAASYTPSAAVAATAVHGLRIKVGQNARGNELEQQPLMISVVPNEFARIPKRYGGHVPGSSGIMTDIPTGHSIFRNESPFVGSPVYVQRGQKLDRLPDDYFPMAGDVFVIVVNRPKIMPSEVECENRVGGRVIVRYPDKADEVVASVVSPVLSIGRYDGTTFTGVGSVNTNHGGVLTISSAPVCPPNTIEGGPVETRGGFMIQPYYHVFRQSETKGQVMVIGPKDKSTPIMEGTPPLFFGYINLARFDSDPSCSYRVQVSIDNGPWEDMPQIVGRVEDALTANKLTSLFNKMGKPRNVTTGVTSIKLLFPRYDAALIAKDLETEAIACAKRASKTYAKRAAGRIDLDLKNMPTAVDQVNMYLDGKLIAVTNNYPYGLELDSSQALPGLHSLTLECLSTSSELVMQTRKVISIGS